ncbi:LAS seventeen-binding protein 3 [Desulforamulus aquiferis]|uniref:LAS seventeen-binding protein 3 n=1 Tax=Desulforamulus aquiferis TaxID=1397668 RepID=A0AAW7ZAL3_9FIRM|nr:LAS seventeen-binding protein 3 [Desulforamulus aquiferis]MDO7786134.1 LAS seventeen-binding protein 3 [Desulforamulus aquiferis]RYD04491.1 LAS seventeen-binding protein 3 [Desulforamulus aquiferis]
MAKDNRNNYQKEEEKHYQIGKNFVQEPTGSATSINLDGQWEHDFYDKNKSKNRSGGTGDNPLAE